MNAEELRGIAETLLVHVEETDAVSLLEQLRQAVERQATNPQDPASQSAVADARSRLAESLAAGAADEFNARWRRIVDGMGIGVLLPREMLRRLDEMFLQHQVTLQVVNEGIAAMASDVTAAVEELKSLVQTLGFLHIESSHLLPGEFEAEVVIPRAEVDNSLSGLGREFEALEELIRPFVELEVGSPPPLELRQIASSDFMAAVLMTPGAAVLLSKAIDGVLAVYERVLRIRKLRQELREAGLPEETIERVEQDATELVEREIPAIVRDVMEGAASMSDGGRRNEIEIAINRSVHGIVRRVDHGFRMTVRSGPPPEEDAGDEAPDSGPLNPQVAAARNLVIDNQRRADAQELVGDPILRELGRGDEGEIRE